MKEIWERQLSADEIGKAVCRFANMSEPSTGTELQWKVGDQLEVLGVTIRQKGWNRIDGQDEPEDRSK